MAARPLPAAKRDAIVADWRMGELSMRRIAEKHACSRGAVQALCKDVAQDGPAIVAAGVQYRQGLAKQSAPMVAAVTSEVEELTRRLEFFDDAQLTLAQVALDRVIDERGQAKKNVPMAEVKQVSDVVSTSRTGVLPAKTPGVAIQINNAPAYSVPEYQQALRQVLDEI